MAFATVYVIPGNIELFIWIPIFIICAWFIAKRAPGNYFWHGFMVSIFNCVWIVAAHVLLYNTYIANHPEEAAMMHKMPHYMHLHPRQAMIMTGPIFGIIFGLIIGLFSWIASKIVKK
jgi:hypothetical protein